MGVPSVLPLPWLVHQYFLPFTKDNFTSSQDTPIKVKIMQVPRRFAAEIVSWLGGHKARGIPAPKHIQYNLGVCKPGSSALRGVSGSCRTPSLRIYWPCVREVQCTGLTFYWVWRMGGLNNLLQQLRGPAHAICTLDPVLTIKLLILLAHSLLMLTHADGIQFLVRAHTTLKPDTLSAGPGECFVVLCNPQSSAVLQAARENFRIHAQKFGTIQPAESGPHPLGLCEIRIWGTP